MKGKKFLASVLTGFLLSFNFSFAEKVNTAKEANKEGFNAAEITEYDLWEWLQGKANQFKREDIYNYFTQCSYLYYQNKFKYALEKCDNVINLEKDYFGKIDLTTLKLYVQLLFILDEEDSRKKILELLEYYKKSYKKLKPEGYIFLVKTYSRLGKIKLAEAELEKALRLYPNNKDLLEYASKFYLYISKLDKAISILKKLTKINPNNPKYYYLIGRVYILKGDYNSAEKYFLKSLDVDPKYDPSIQILLEHYLTNNMYHKAEILIKKVLGKNPDNIKLLKILYFVYIMENKIDDAQKVLNQIGKLNPEEKRKIIEENELLYKKALTSKEFIENLKALELQNPNDPNILYTLGLVYYLKNNYKEAERYLKRAINVKRDFVDAYELLLDIYVKENRLKEAKEILNKLKKLRPKDYTIYVYLANIEYELGNIKKAIYYIKKAIDLNPKNSNLYYYLAYYYDNLGDWEKVKYNLEKAIRLDPKNADALNYLGYSLILRNEDIDRGIELVKRALKIAPNNPAYLDSLGWGYFKKGNLIKARYYLEKAYNQLPNDPVMNAHMGELYEKLGKYKKALKFYKKSLELLKKEKQEPEPGITKHVKERIKALEKKLKK